MNFNMRIGIKSFLIALCIEFALMTLVGLPFGTLLGGIIGLAILYAARLVNWILRLITAWVTFIFTKSEIADRMVRAFYVARLPTTNNILSSIDGVESLETEAKSSNIESVKQLGYGIKGAMDAMGAISFISALFYRSAIDEAIRRYIKQNAPNALRDSH
jgi:hypothetical protein